MSNVVKEEAVWKTYPGIDFLQVNQFGEVRTIDHYVTYKNGVKHFYKGHVLKQYPDRGGYMTVYISVNGKRLHLLVHRVVATCFLPNPDNLPEVNHKDCNRANNNVNNLEWCTPQENTAYRDKLGHTAKHNAPKKPVFAVNLKTLEVLHFESRNEAARQLGVDSGHINDVLKGRYKYTGGYWFTENEDEITKEKIQEIKDSMKFLGGVYAVNLKTLEASRFESRKEAAHQLGIDPSSITKVAKGRQKQTGGYWFCYADENAVENIRVKFGNDVASKVEKLLDEN